MSVDRDPNVARKQQEVKDAKVEFVRLLDMFVKSNVKVKSAFEVAPTAVKANRNHIKIVLDDMMDAFVTVMADTLANSDAEFEDIPAEFYIQLYRDKNGHSIKKAEAIQDLKDAIAEKQDNALLERDTIPDWFNIIKDEIHPAQLGGLYMKWEGVIEGFSALMMKGQALAAENSSQSITEQTKMEVLRIQQEAAQSGELGNAFAGASGGIGSMSESPAKLLELDKGDKITFDDVAGIDEALEEVQEVVDFLKSPDKYTKMGAKIPKGILLHGEPGTGKTLLARATAGEAGVPFYAASGSDFVEMYVGLGAARVREMFKELRENAPCILFIDEIDAVGGQRQGGGNGGSKEDDKTINALLTELNGIQSDSNVIVMAATNRPDMLDSALTRPGRFDRQVNVPLPDAGGREKILQIHTKKKPLVTDTNDPSHVDLRHVARATPGFSGADLANLANEAAILAVKNGHDAITHDDFAEARDNVRMGRKRSSNILNEDEIKNTAYHEVGHSLTNILLEPWAQKFERVTIVPRGRALGVSMSIPDEGRASRSHVEFLAQMIITAGGRAAELVKFGPENVTSGASSDIDHNSATARAMVSQWGFSKKLGQVRYGQRLGDIFSGAGAGAASGISNETQAIIDEEVRELVNKASEDAEKILRHNKDVFEEWSQELIEHETLDRRQVADKYLPRLELPADLNILKEFGLGTDKQRLPAQPQAKGQKPS